MRGEPTHRSAGNSTAHFHGADHHFHAGNRRPRKRLALELHVEATAFLSGDADRSRILSRAPKEKFPKPVAEAAARIFFAAQQESAPSIAKQTAEFARDAVGCECPAVHVRSDHRNGPCHARSNQRLRHCKRVEQSKAAPANIQSAAVLSRQQPGVQLRR